VRVLEVSGPDSVCPFIAMELLSGVDLGTQLRERPRLSLEDVADMVEQISAGLEVAHAAGVVHRDLKPQNVFRAGGAHGLVTWKILDFGVSKLLDSGEASLTAAEIIGTPQYMAPEQARGERDVDARADIYALSAMAYRALTGEAPFRGDLHAILRAILEEMPEAPSARARLPEDIDLVLAIGLAKKREERFQSASELAKAFEDATRGRLSPDLRTRARMLLAAQPYRG
jgi:serine/threonine-protein kinase